MGNRLDFFCTNNQTRTQPSIQNQNEEHMQNKESIYAVASNYNENGQYNISRGSLKKTDNGKLKNHEDNNIPHRIATTKPGNDKKATSEIITNHKDSIDYDKRTSVEHISTSFQSHQLNKNVTLSMVNEKNTRNLPGNRQMHHQTAFVPLEKHSEREQKNNRGNHDPSRPAMIKYEDYNHGNKNEQRRLNSEHVAGHVSNKTVYKYESNIEEDLNFNVDSSSSPQIVKNVTMSTVDERDRTYLNHQNSKLVTSLETRPLTQGHNSDYAKFSLPSNDISSTPNFDHLNNLHNAPLSNLEKKIPDQENTYEKKTDEGEGVTDVKDVDFKEDEFTANKKHEENYQKPNISEEEIKTPDEEHQVSNLTEPNSLPIEAAKSELSLEIKQALEQINKIKYEREILVNKVENFSGPDIHADYLYLDEMLTRNLLQLDNVETYGDKELRGIRREAIKENHAALSNLKLKVEEYNKKQGKIKNKVTKKQNKRATGATAPKQNKKTKH